MTDIANAQPFHSLATREILGRRMAYIDYGAGRPIVFQHGNPTSSYLWRNVMRGCDGLGRLIACDLIGMGGSDKIEGEGDARYGWDVHYAHLDALWQSLDLGDGIVLVLHDWGSALGFQWAMDHPERVAGIVYMEAIVGPMTWSEWPEGGRRMFQGFRSEAGESLILDRNLFIDRVLPGSILRALSDDEMAHYRAPYPDPGEARRPMLAWPRLLPVDGEPADFVERARNYGEFLRTSSIPKLFINADPGSILVGSAREYCRSWANQREITVPGLHFIQEDSAAEIATGIRAFVRELNAE